MTSESPLRLEFTMHFERKPHGKKKLVTGETPARVGHVPRVARVLALAHHFDYLIEQGIIKDYAEIARLVHMTRARVTQIMYLKYLSPHLQEQITLLPQSHGKDLITEKQLRRIAMIPEWDQQLIRFKEILTQ